MSEEMTPWNPEHLAVFKQGRDAIESWLKDHPNAAFNLKEADLSNCDLRGITLHHRAPRHDFTGAIFRNAVLSKSVLEKATFALADFSGADLRAADFEATNLRGARFHSASLFGTWFDNANLKEANFDGADLKEASLIGADLRTATGFVLDSNDLKGVRFSARAKDPWSTVRRRYTGVMTAFHLMLATIACAPFLVRALFSYAPGASDHTRLAVVTGWAEGSGTFAMTMGILLYNLLRVTFTHQLSQLREEEQRSNYAPAKNDYWHFWVVDRWVMQWAELVVFVMAVTRTYSWLLQPAGLPLK